jgi:DNA-binding LytR/AlgR family response regulator
MRISTVPENSNGRQKHAKAQDELWPRHVEGVVDELLSRARIPVLRKPNDVPGQNEGRIRPTTIAIRSRRKIIFVDLAEVMAIEAHGSYVALRTPSGTHLLRQSISAVSAGLKPYRFFRIHRSTIVNARFVEQIRTSASGSAFVRLKRLKKEYAASRGYRSVLKLTVSWCLRPAP